MKVYISVDIEGVAGIVDRAQGSLPGIDYERGRRLMTQEAAAAVRGALAGGASEVWVSDSHGSNGSRNIIIEDLPQECWLISGDSRPMVQVEGLDRSFAALAMVGYHARHGLSGVLDHTISGREVYELKLNGRPVGEVGLNAAVAGHLGVPVVVVSGDHKLAGEVAEILPWTEYVVVKYAIGRHASKAMHPQRARQAIQDGLTRALGRLSQMELFEISKPVTADLTFKHTSMADAAAGMPGVGRVNDLTVRITAPDAVAVYPLIMTAIHLGGHAVSSPMKLGTLNPPGS
ncbi:MAG: M55 family metallopeptidase [Armatimonadota bacterium]